MQLDFYNSKLLQYIVYLLLFISAQSFSMVGQYISLPYKDLTYYQSLTMCLPFAWVDWFLMTFAIDIGHTYNLVTPTQDIFLLIILQFTLVLIINQFYLKQKIYRSDIIAFLILLLGYFISFFRIISKMLNYPIEPKSSEKDEKKESENNNNNNN